MSGIDAARWAEAEDATEWKCSQVQGFLYRDDDAVKNDQKSGLHVCRDLTKPSGKQTFWQRDAGHDEYEEAHKEMMHQLRLYRLGIVIEEYMSPSPKLDVRGSWAEEHERAQA